VVRIEKAFVKKAFQVERLCIADDADDADDADGVREETGVRPATSLDEVLCRQPLGLVPARRG
jgi:hypothetical protein